MFNFKIFKLINGTKDINIYLEDSTDILLLNIYSILFIHS
jgi:hypothetical protein